ncbi:MAG: signal recognition particle protein [Chitinispirillales bacterium]|jgi:signal recognition particle subunit SRP54|nr:signal recognition particle protein [Chitinispirillales bacterium]
MFEDLSGKLEEIVKNMRGTSRITGENVSTAMHDVKRALLEADVNFKVVKDFIAKVKEKSLGEEVVAGVNAGQMFVKIVYDELAILLGGAARKIVLQQNKTNVILMTGLQGSGKTTHCAKLALHFRKTGHTPLLAACDVHRPAAIDQLETLGKSLNIPVYSERGQSAEIIAKNSLKFAEKNGNSIVIADTAGRLHIDNEMMNELRQIKEVFNPIEVFFVADAMTGQEAVNVASEFHSQINCTGIILAKMDGDARGGAALSVFSVTGVPICYIGTGEKPDALEMFYPDRLASRILGMGDIVSLVEKAQEVVDFENSKELEKKILKNRFTFQDFLEQLRQIQKMGSIKDILGMIPGIGKQISQIDIDPKQFKHIEAIILSMTVKERLNPSIINGSRRMRIAKGSGRSVQEINRLLKQFDDMRVMMKQMGKFGKNGKLSAMQSRMKNMGI